MPLLFLLLFPFLCLASPNCSYQSWDWDTVNKKSINHKKIVKSKSELSLQERGVIPGCSVCEEDQSEIRLHPLAPFKICAVFKDRVQAALDKARAQGFPINSVSTYRVGKSKGVINTKGERTEFSNHSYGTAIDINSEINGLYDQCQSFSPSCRLIRGGAYQSNLPGSITRESPLYREMLAAGFKWGGEIEGRQKDFMHFSLDGY